MRLSLANLLIASGYSMAIITNQEVLESGFEKIATRANTLWLGEDGIFRIVHLSGAALTLGDAHEARKYCAGEEGQEWLKGISNER